MTGRGLHPQLAGRGTVELSGAASPADGGGTILFRLRSRREADGIDRGTDPPLKERVPGPFAAAPASAGRPPGRRRPSPPVTECQREPTASAGRFPDRRRKVESIPS